MSRNFIFTLILLSIFILQSTEIKLQAFYKLNTTFLTFNTQNSKSLSGGLINFQPKLYYRSPDNLFDGKPGKFIPNRDY